MVQTLRSFNFKCLLFFWIRSSNFNVHSTQSIVHSTCAHLNFRATKCAFPLSATSIFPLLIIFLPFLVFSDSLNLRIRGHYIEHNVWIQPSGHLGSFDHQDDLRPFQDNCKPVFRINRFTFRSVLSHKKSSFLLVKWMSCDLIIWPHLMTFAEMKCGTRSKPLKGSQKVS